MHDVGMTGKDEVLLERVKEVPVSMSRIWGNAVWSARGWAWLPVKRSMPTVARSLWANQRATVAQSGCFTLY